MAKALFFKLMDEKYGRDKNLSCLIQFDSVKRAIRTKVFGTKYLKRKHYKIFINYCTISTTVPSSSWLAKHWQKLNLQQEASKKCAILFLSKYSDSGNFLSPSKGYLKTGPMSTSKVELAVTIIEGSPIYAKSPVLVRRLPDLSSITNIIVML